MGFGHVNVSHGVTLADHSRNKRNTHYAISIVLASRNSDFLCVYRSACIFAIWQGS